MVGSIGLTFALLGRTGAHKPSVYRDTYVSLSLVVKPTSPLVRMNLYIIAQ